MKILFSNSLSEKTNNKSSQSIKQLLWDKCAKKTLDIYNL